jgi:hypothetical protein
MLTLGGTENPNALATFAKSKSFTLNIFFKLYDA